MPLGSSTFRKKTASRRLPALMPRPLGKLWRRAANNPPMTGRRLRLADCGRNFQFPGPTADVVSEILSRHSDLVAAAANVAGTSSSPVFDPIPAFHFR